MDERCDHIVGIFKSRCGISLGHARDGTPDIPLKCCPECGERLRPERDRDTQRMIQWHEKQIELASERGNEQRDRGSDMELYWDGVTRAHNDTMDMLLNRHDPAHADLR